MATIIDNTNFEGRTLLLISEQEHVTILAALHHYRNTYPIHYEIREIATKGGTLNALNEHDIRELIADISP